MTQCLNLWSYKGYEIALMHDAGAHWYEVCHNGEFVANCETMQEAHMEINVEVMK